MRQVGRVLLVYNTDYDAELKEQSGADVSAVQEAARAVRQAVSDYGHDAELVGVHGRRDLGALLERLSGAERPELVFNLVESLDGDTRNESLVPSLLDLYGIPYTGPSALTIGLCLHKDRCKHVLRGHDIATPPSLVVRHLAELGDPSLRARLERLAYPYFLKLTREDASIGIEASNVVADPSAFLARARELLERYQQPVLAEAFVAGREVNVTLVGNEGELEVLPLFEIDFGAMPAGRPNIISYAAKWDESHVDYGGSMPRPMDEVGEDVADAIRATARAAFLALGLRDFGRVDLRVDEDGTPWVIDVNPNCDLSPDAGVARTALHAGLAYPALIGRICDLAWRRHGTEHPRPGAR